jgi:hypothetical protein
LIVTSAFIAFNGQLKADKDTAYYKEQFESLEKRGQELSDQATGGKGYAYVAFSIGYDREHDPNLSEYYIMCDLYTQSKYKLENIAVNLKQKFRTPGKEDHQIIQFRLPHAIKASPNDTVENWHQLDPINSFPILSKVPIRKVDTEFYFKVTMLQLNYGEIYQTTILRRLRETEKPFESYRWVKATLVETSKEVLEQIVDKDFPRMSNGQVDWDTRWLD